MQKFAYACTIQVGYNFEINDDASAIVFRGNLFRIIYPRQLFGRPAARSFERITVSVSHPVYTTDPTLPHAVLQSPLNTAALYGEYNTFAVSRTRVARHGAVWRGMARYGAARRGLLSGALFSREYDLVRAKGGARFFIRLQSGSKLQRDTHISAMTLLDNSRIVFHYGEFKASSANLYVKAMVESSVLSMSLDLHMRFTKNTNKLLHTRFHVKHIHNLSNLLFS